MKTHTPDHIQNLTIDESVDGCICLEQDTGGTINRVYLHPVHLRHLAEMAGLIHTVDSGAAKTIAMLTRRLLALRERIAHLDHWLANYSDKSHTSLDYEQSYASATAEIADEFCAELPDTMPTPCKPDANTVQARSTTVQGNGALVTSTPQASLV